MADGTTRSRGDDYSIQELAELARSGQLRIPEFQRSFRWDAGDVRALFDSILRGYPVGSVLLWRKSAPAKRITLGAMIIEAPDRPNAIWVVDGQQRITTLVNAINPAVYAEDSRFRLDYSPESRRFLRPSDPRSGLVLPLPDLFDVSRLLDWLQENPDAREYASEIQSVTARLRDFKLPASVVEQADEGVLREIFDRMNTAGKRLRSAEIFDAIHRASGDGDGDDLSIGAIAERLEASTTFGRVEPDVVYQAILVRRHPDITRDPHEEFQSERRIAGDFSQESREQGFLLGEKALQDAIRFLTEEVGVPHVAFLPYRFLLLVLVRFFGLFPNAHSRNLVELRRWFWTASARASELGLTGSTGTVRSLAGNLALGDEDGSVRRLLSAVRSSKAIPLPDTTSFRTNQAASKIVLCGLWSLAPMNPETHERIDASELVAALSDAASLNEVVTEIVSRRRVDVSHRLSAGNRLIAPWSSDESVFDQFAITGFARDERIRDAVLASHALTEELLSLAESSRIDQFIVEREHLLNSHVERFLKSRTGAGFEYVPPLESLDLDDEFGSEVPMEDDAAKWDLL